MFHRLAIQRAFLATRRLWFVLLTALALNFVVVDDSAHAATYYVATTGSDSNPGTDSAPFRTIAKGSRAMAGGDTLYVRAGTYNESLTSFKNGNAGAYTRFTAAPGDEGKVIIKPSGTQFVLFFSVNTAYVEVSNLVLDGMDVKLQTIKIDHNFNPVYKGAYRIRLLRNDIIGSRNAAAILGGTDCEIIGNRIRNGGSYGIYTGGGGGGGLIEGNIIYDNGGFAIHLYQEHQPVNGWVIRNNIIYGNGRGKWKHMDNGPDRWQQTSAVVLARGSNQFYNNIVYNNPYGGITVGYGAKDMLVANNTVYNNGYGGSSACCGTKDGIEVLHSSRGTKIINNISYGNAGSQIDDGGVNTTLQNNLMTDPKFVNAAGGDFHLQAGSPAIDAGQTLAEVTNDFAYGVRPWPAGGAYDIGAYEFGSPPGSGPSPPPPSGVPPAIPRPPSTYDPDGRLCPL